MAYIKFKEMTHYFNFHKELSEKELPKFVEQYLEPKEEVWKAYGTKRDKCVFTDRKIILFDVQGLTGSTKKIHIFPYRSLNSSAIVFKNNSVYLLYTFTSGYQMRLNYINLSSDDKKELRIIFNKLSAIMTNEN